MLESTSYHFIDPFEIQCFPPRVIDEALEAAQIEYPDLLEAVAGLLRTRSPRFAQDLCEFLASYMHEHNFTQPLTAEQEQMLRDMIQKPETVNIGAFETLVPVILKKATTLAVETFVQTRTSWVLKAIPHMNILRRAMLQPNCF